MTKHCIEGKVYDTKTATFVYEFSNEDEVGDLFGVCETLYRTDRGTFFVIAEGGAGTVYARSSGNHSTSGCDAYVLSDEEAQAWLHDRQADYDTIAEYFELQEG